MSEKKKIDDLHFARERIKNQFQIWLGDHCVVNTRQWEALSTHEVSLLAEALWKDFYENYLLNDPK